MEKEILYFLETKLSKKRYVHTINVAKMAETIAKKNNIDIAKCRMASLLHDVLKEENKDILLHYIDLSDIMYKNNFLKITHIWHGFAASEFIQTEFGIIDLDVINAVKYHTTARENMSDIEKVVFVSDLISLDRNYEEVDLLREAVMNDFEEGFKQALKYNLIYLIKSNKVIYQQSLDAYNWYAK